MLSIDTEEHTTSFVAAVGGRWGKWAGGVLAPNGLIYAIPALADAMLEIDPDKNTVSMFGMLPDSRSLEDKWNGGVLAPNGKSTPRAAAASALCVPRRPARPVPKLTSLASGRGRRC